MDQELLKIHSWIILHLEGRLSASDSLELEKWKDAHPLNRQLFEELVNRETLEIELHKLRSVDTDAALERFKLEFENENPSHLVPVPRVRYLHRWHWWAAAVFLIAAATVFLVVSSNRAHKIKPLAHTSHTLPLDSGAILTLADGSRIVLDSIHDGVVAVQGGDSAKIVNGALVYGANGDQVVYNTMSTQTGGQFHLTLSDGTVVWLNSVSSIRYPTVFVGNERLVEITGEAYFEVARNKKMPFRVKINEHTEVTVLGTKFNINAYQDEPTINTTLLEGLVRIKSGRDSLNLHPGEQAQSRPSGDINRTLVLQEMDRVVAWKNGLFSFNNAGLEVLTRQMKRWYGIDTKFEGPVPDKIFNGELDRGVKLEAVLNWFTELGIKNRLEGRTLIIYK